jgi:hypothetical protein
MTMRELDDGVAFLFTTVDKLEVLARWKTRDEDDDMRPARSWASRAYVTITAADVPMTRPPYGSQQGDGTEEDRLWAAYNQLELVAMRRKLNSAFAAMQAAGYAPDGTWEFSRYAGCSCPCSPGFVFSDQIRAPHPGVTYPFPVEVWVSDKPALEDGEPDDR